MQAKAAPPSSAALVEQARRNARRLAKQAGIPLHQAQDQIARSKGFGNWSQFAKGSGHAASPAPRVRLKPDRYYLHGDQEEGNPASYYCAECDLFADADHFNQTHRQPHGERALNAIERFEHSSPEFAAGERRPPSPPNLLQAAIEEAKQARTEREAARSPFHRWIELQRDRADPVGDLAGDILRDRRFPTGVTSFRAAVRYLTERLASRHAIEALRQAWREFDATRLAEFGGAKR